MSQFSSNSASPSGFVAARPLRLLWIALVFCIVISGQGYGQRGTSSADGIRIRNIPPSRAFSDSVAPNALRLACASYEPILAGYFRQEGIPFDRTLVRHSGPDFCHVLYQPTVSGFHALSDAAPLRGLLVDVEPLSLLSQRRTQHGDSLDIVKTLFPRLPASLAVTLGLAGKPSADVLSSALAFHFQFTSSHAPPKVVSMREQRKSTGNAWAQDYMKSGHVNGRPVRLVTRLAFEGRSDNGARFKPMLDALHDKETVRSNLSWEGGDLQFHEDPRDPSRTLLFYGESARHYWGTELTAEEYGFVLKLEFGADETFDFSGIVPHVDYFVAVLPEDKIALVAEPMTGNLEIARQAASFLQESFGNLPELVELEASLKDPAAMGDGQPRVRAALAKTRQQQANWQPVVNAEVYALLERHLEQNCPERPDDCFQGRALEKILAGNQQLLRAWVNTAMQVRAAEFLPTAMLSVIESQLPGGGTPTLERIAAKVTELESLGFNVIRVPVIGGDQSAPEPWAGISYANMAVVDHTLFVPAFGFGEAEQQIFDQLQSKLKPKYTVVPVNARYALLQNGGVHCVLGFVRDPKPTSIAPNISQSTQPASEQTSRRD